MEESLLTCVSIGVVARDILEDDMYVDIYPIEIQPNKNGETSKKRGGTVASDKNSGELTVVDNLSSSVKDMDDMVNVINVSRTDLITAKWLPDGDTHLLTPPNVCKGETVRLFRYADTDKYYWQTLYNQLELRKLEKRTIVVSNKTSIDITPEELLKYSYFCTMDSINKIVHLHTSMTDGEYTSFDITIDTKEGMLEITDGKGNSIFLESQDDRITTTTNKEIVNNTVDKTENIHHKHTVNLVKYAVNHQNGDELLKILYDLVTANINDLGVGNLGANVARTSNTVDSYKLIQQRLAAYMS